MAHITRSVALVLSLAPTIACTREPAASAKRYPITGQVLAVDIGERKVTIAHQDIPGFMPAMTMPFVVLEKDQAILKAIAPGDRITATLVAPDSRYWIEEIVVVRKGTPDPGATVPPQAREPQPGDLVPDVALVDQDGNTLHLADYRGRAVAVTFIFTRCPLPDFCPLMMKNFAQAHATLAADAALMARTHLLAVSFDARHDKPAVLRAYGMPYQRTAPPFVHWRLASGSEPEIRRLGEAFGLDYSEEAGGFTHNLRTVVIDSQGRLFRIYNGNEWKPAELVAALTAASG